MTRMIRDALIVSIRAQHDFNAEVSRRVFVGPRARQYARDWAEREIHIETTVEIDQ